MQDRKLGFWEWFHSAVLSIDVPDRKRKRLCDHCGKETIHRLGVGVVRLKWVCEDCGRKVSISTKDSNALYPAKVGRRRLAWIWGGENTARRNEGENRLRERAGLEI